mmetsp:Transcript_3605/g.2656  ORF Transcript_3605/g.2656 Transcript_3605/m.2656 type:complete len:173 (-) Transcript_3605:342-860(-)
MSPYLISSDQSGRILCWTTTTFHPTVVKGEVHTSSVSQLVVHGGSLFSASVDGTLKKSMMVSEGQFEVAKTKKFEGMDFFSLVAGPEKTLFALFQANIIAAIDTDSLEVVKQEEVKNFDGQKLAYSPATHELWVGDKKGNIHILSADDFVEKKVIEKKHQQAVTTIVASRDG